MTKVSEPQYMRLHFSIGCYDCRRTSRRRQSIQFRRNSNPFLLIMCIDAPESTTNSLSSSLRVDGAGRHLFSEGEKNAALFHAPWVLDTLLASLLAAPLAGTLLLPFRLFLRPILKFWSIGVTLMRMTWANHVQAMDFGLENVWCDVQQILWILHIGSVSICLSSSAKSMKTSAAPCPVIHNPIVVYLMKCTQKVRGLARDRSHGKQRLPRSTHATYTL